MQAMQDPSQGIHRDLLPHTHLVSSHRYPNTPSHLHPERVADWLLNAPRIVREQAVVFWTYLDRPVDSTILLEWQSPALGNEYPSDGYIWAPGELIHSLEVMGYTLEIYQCKNGYAPGEPYAVHSRRRYRLLPPRVPTQNLLPDPNLWIIHYTQSEERIPFNIIPVDARVQHINQARQHLHQQGSLLHKEFMLHDRAAWPTIDFPRGRPRGAQMYSGAMPQRVPQQMAYPTHALTGPPSKRRATQQTHAAQGAQLAPNAQQVAAAQSLVPAVVEVDVEDTHFGDFFDLTTPREISKARFERNTDWMQEVLSSPYAINQIIPADLGLGVRGELGSLTDGIFHAPYNEEVENSKTLNYVGHLDPGKAEEFRNRANDRIAQINNDMEKMKAKHAKRIAKFQRGASISQAEKELRTALNDPEDTGSEYWRLEGKIDEEENDEDNSPVPEPLKVDDVLAKVEASLGRHAVAIEELRRIQAGGYEEIVHRASPPPQSTHHDSQQSGVLVNEADGAISDINMGNSTAGLSNQFHNGSPSIPTPANATYPSQGHLQHPSASAANTLALNLATSPHPSHNAGTPQSEHQYQQPTKQEQQDVQMTDAVSTGEAQQSITAPAPTSTDTSDWVVVPPGGVSPTTDPSNTNTTHNTEISQQQPRSTTAQPIPSSQVTSYAMSIPGPITPHTTSIPGPLAAPATNIHTQPFIQAQQPTQINNNLQQPPHQIEEQQQPPEAHTDLQTELNENDFDLEDLDTAGDALASYDGDHGMGDLVDESAFGEAFHGVEHGHLGADGDEGL